MNRTLLDLLDWVDHAITVAVIVSGLVGFIFRSWIVERIKAGFARAVNKELETEKHKLTKELESYKSALLRELEVAKAGIDIRRNIALKLAEANLGAISSLFQATDALGTLCGSFPTLPHELRIARHAEMKSAFDAFAAAFRQAEIFLDSALVGKLAEFHKQGAAIYGEFVKQENAAVVLTTDDEQVRRWIGLKVELSSALQASLNGIQNKFTIQ